MSFAFAAVPCTRCRGSTSTEETQNSSPIFTMPWQWKVLKLTFIWSVSFQTVLRVRDFSFLLRSEGSATGWPAARTFCRQQRNYWWYASRQQRVFQELSSVGHVGNLQAAKFPGRLAHSPPLIL
ncbi:hypothetical protein ACQ86N_16475 [Puia sp. P3]|uniref:hypothetical protein n=1 Tax=Puia sp. P3 TaxID=3423952 RepID=UPI003D677BFB